MSEASMGERGPLRVLCLEDSVGDAELIWPYRAYNVYGGPPHLMPSEEAVAILRVPLEPVRDRADVTFRLD